MEIGLGMLSFLPLYLPASTEPTGQQLSQSAWSAVTPHHYQQANLRRLPPDQNPKDKYATAADSPEQHERILIQVGQFLNSIFSRNCKKEISH